MATVARLYTELHRRGLPIDTAQFPWFFSNPAAASSTPAAPRSLGARITYALGFLIRRDANVTGTALLLLFHQRRVAAALLCAGAAVGLVLTVTHYAVMATRPARTPR